MYLITFRFILLLYNIFRELSNKNRIKIFSVGIIPQTDFECRYIVTSETLKQLKLIFDKCIDFTEKQLRVA